MLKALKTLDQKVEKIFKAIAGIFEIISIIGMIGIMIMLVVQTVLKWFSVSLLWSDELVSVLNIWLVFMAASVVSHENKHVKVDFIVKALPEKVQVVLDLIISGLCLFAAYHIFMGGIQYIKNTGNIVTNILRLPMITMYIAPLLAIGFMMLMMVRDVIHLIVCLFNKKETEGEA